MDNIMSSKLFTTRQGTVLLGVIAAVIAAIALIIYLNHYRNSVNANSAAIQVLVANKLIQQGTSGDVLRTNPSYYETTGIAKSHVETGAITDPATLAGQVALADISPGQQLTASDFGPAGSSIAYNLNPNQRAVVVALGSPQTVGGQITAGSHVDFWVTSGGTGNGVARPTARLLFQDMYVLGLSGENVTLRADTPRQAGQILWAATNDTPWLVLRPTVANNTKSRSVGG